MLHADGLWRWLGWLGGALLVAASTACGESGRNYGSGSSSGDAGAGAQGGSGTAGGSGRAGESGSGGAPAACSTDPDCDDQNGCNGVERCVDGVCEDGEPFCAGEQETDCTVTCSEASGAPVCAKENSDADGDGHAPADSTCSASDKPRDDCDDDDELTYPGADETCDGVDTDCDGRQDIDDGFPLSGAPVRIGPQINSTYDSAGAWSAELDSFAIYYHGQVVPSDEGPAEQRFFSIDPDGNVGSEVSLGTTSTMASRLAAGHMSFGHLYMLSGASLHFRRYDAAGAAIGDVVTVREPGTTLRDSALLHTAQGWIASWIDGSLRARRLNVDGTTATVVVPDLAPDTTAEAELAATTNGDEIAFAYDSDEGIHVSRWTQELVALGEPLLLSAEGSDPAIAAGATSYGVAWVGTWPDVVFAEVSSEGQLLCGPVKIGENTVPEKGAVAVQPYGSGFLLAHADNATYRVLLRRIGAMCAPIDPGFVIDDATGAYKGIVELHGGSGFLATWREPNALQGFRRFFGPQLCD